MYWTIADFFWNRFTRKKPKQSADSYAILYDQLVQKHQISISGDESFSLGKEFINKEDAESYVENVLKLQFQNLHEEFKTVVQKEKETYNNLVSNLKDEISRIENDLNETSPEGMLGKLEKEKKEIELRVNELEYIYCPEKKMIPYIKESLIQFKENLNKVTAAVNDDNIVKEFAEKQKAVTAFAYRESRNQKKILIQAGPDLKNLHYPPRLSLVWLFYFICFLLLICEVGVSMRVVRGVANFPFTNTQIINIFSAIYAIGISLTLAVIFKILIDKLSNKNMEGYVIFILVYLVLTFCMIIFFAAETTESSKSAFSIKLLTANRVLVLGILSTSFSIANALLFKEASRIKNLYNKLYPNRNLRNLNKLKEKLRKKCIKKLNQKNSQLGDIVQLLNSFEADHVSAIISHINRLEKINISSFWLGYDSVFAELSLSHYELDLANIKRTKRRL